MQAKQTRGVCRPGRQGLRSAAASWKLPYFRAFSRYCLPVMLQFLSDLSCMNHGLTKGTNLQPLVASAVMWQALLTLVLMILMWHCDHDADCRMHKWMLDGCVDGQITDCYSCYHCCYYHC